ncbi:MAG: O-methyltransferase [Eubacterium sp.]|jgi:predicted O-methyltransferase YrrM|nr:O-methyltransferase [Eubacterium sp.]
MVVEERLRGFIHSLDSGNTKFLDRIEQEAISQNVPVIKKETQQFLKMLLSMNRPKKILEIGTAVGFSALLMAEYSPKDCSIVTIENYERRILAARENFKNAGKENQITLIEGDAAVVLASMEKSFDFIFLDAAKGQYIHFLPDIIRLLQNGGTLVTDNVLQDGDILESRFAVTRRNRTIHKRMREYLYEVMHNDALVSAVLPIGDGLTVSTKKG